jgi:hypothetical protein
LASTMIIAIDYLQNVDAVSDKNYAFINVILI